MVRDCSCIHSLLNWYKSLIALRKSNQALRYGGTIFVDRDNPNVLGFIHTAPTGTDPVLVLMNMTASPRTATTNLAELGSHNSQLYTFLASARVPEAADASAVQVPPYCVWIATIR